MNHNPSLATEVLSLFQTKKIPPNPQYPWSKTPPRQFAVSLHFTSSSPPFDGSHSPHRRIPGKQPAPHPYCLTFTRPPARAEQKTKTGPDQTRRDETTPNHTSTISYQSRLHRGYPAAVAPPIHPTTNDRYMFRDPCCALRYTTICMFQ